MSIYVTGGLEEDEKVAQQGASELKAMLDCQTPRKPLRVTQHKDEPPDLFAIRAWVEAMRFMEPNAMMAAANWISARTQAELDSIRKQSNS